MRGIIGKKIMITGAMTALLVVLFVLFRDTGQRMLPSVTLSAPSGFYDSPFYLSMSCENGQIYYTTDGSRPDTGSFLYTRPVYISDASENENVYSMRDDISVSFLRDEVRAREGGRLSDYAIPGEKVDKCTVLRAVCIDSLGGRSEEVSASYFVGFGEKEGYDGVYTVSLYTDPANLFDYERGIYVTGKKTADYLEGRISADNDDYWWWWPANYRMRGKEWEREAEIEIFDCDGRPVLKTGAAIRIQGGGSRGYVPRSLNVYSEDTGTGFSGDVFSDGERHVSLTLFAGGDSRITKLEDYLPAELCPELRVSMMDFIPAVMFLDGEFWGFYYITERYDEAYFEANYGVEGNDVIMIKEGEVSLGRGSDAALYEEDMAFLRNVDVTSEDGLRAVEKRIDLDSYIDYYALQLYIDRRNDWPYMNYALWKTRTGDGGEYGDCRWRWMVFDENSGSYGMSNVSSNSITGTREADGVFDNLMRSPEIDKRLRERLLQLAKGCFSPRRVESFVNDYKEKIAPVMHNEFKRFYGQQRDYDHSFDVRTDRFISFFRERYDYITQHIDEL